MHRTADQDIPLLLWIFVLERSHKKILIQTCKNLSNLTIHYLFQGIEVVE